MGLTQDELAEAAGVSRSTVRDFEGHRHELHRATEAQLIEALDRLGVKLLPPGREGVGVRLRKHDRRERVTAKQGIDRLRE